MAADGRTYAEEQETVSAAVISVLHSLMELALDKEVDPSVRLCAAESVLQYARDTVAPAEPFEEPVEEPVEEK